MKKKLIIFGVVVALQCSWILATSLVQERGLTSAVKVLLETRPVDPRDLLRGDYVILEYAVNTIPYAKCSSSMTNGLDYGTPVWVLLEPEPDGKFHRVASASTEQLRPDDTHPVLKGRTEYSWRSGTNGVRVVYDLERYYVSEGTGNPQGKLTVEVAIPKSGRGLITQVFVDGKPYREAMKNWK